MRGYLSWKTRHIFLQQVPHFNTIEPVISETNCVERPYFYGYTGDFKPGSTVTEPSDHPLAENFGCQHNYATGEQKGFTRTPTIILTLGRTVGCLTNYKCCVEHETKKCKPPTFYTCTSLAWCSQGLNPTTESVSVHKLVVYKYPGTIGSLRQHLCLWGPLMAFEICAEMWRLFLRPFKRDEDGGIVVQEVNVCLQVWRELDKYVAKALGGTPVSDTAAKIRYKLSAKNIQIVEINAHTLVYLCKDMYSRDYMYIGCSIIKRLLSVIFKII